MAEITSQWMQGSPGTADKWLCESFARGHGAFLGRITKAGERRFYYRYTGSSGQVRLLIGPYGGRGDGRTTFTVAQARDKARELAALYRSGVRDLREHLETEAKARQAAAQEELDRIETARVLAAQEAERNITVTALFAQWQAAELQPRSRTDGRRTGRKDGGQSVRWMFERRVFPVIGHRPVTDVRKAGLMTILDTARAEGRRRTANVLLAELKQMFRFALVREMIERNPLDTVTRRDAGGPEVPRERVLSASEVQRLVSALPASGLDGRSACAVWLILATAVRVGEAINARWEHIDLVAGTWYLPDTKNQRDHTIRLSAFAVRQLEEIRRLQAIRDIRRAIRHNVTADKADGKTTRATRGMRNWADHPAPASSPWVFPNHTGEAPVDKTTFAKQLADRQRTAAAEGWAGRTRARQSLALPGGKWTPHDLRRTAATMMAELGISADVIDECLNHMVQGTVRRTYIRDRRLAEQARAFDALGARLEAIVSGMPAQGNVVPIQRAA
ncbi:tyrosine-type recombinase/integrase [Rubrivivax albus]|nr:site-specific integrase [Rubrivivax albus]